MAAYQLFDRVQETTTTPGTGAVALAGAVSQYVSFQSVFALNQTFFYTIADTSGTNWETGIGYLSASTTLVRSQVTAGSNGTSLVNFSSGTQAIFVDISAYAINQLPTTGQSMAMKSGYALP